MQSKICLIKFHRFRARASALMVSSLVGLTALLACSQSLNNNRAASNSAPVQRADGFFKLFTNKPVMLDVELKEIRRAAKPDALKPIVVAERSGVFRKYVNEALNSRVPLTIGRSAAQIRWRRPLPSSFEPRAIIQSGERIVVEAEGAWFLFGGDGKEIAYGHLGASGIIADDTLFYAADRTGMIIARRLSDGGIEFNLSLYFGNSYARNFLMRKDKRFLAVSTERELDPDSPAKPERSVVELVDLGNTLETGEGFELKSARTVDHMARKTDLLLAAGQGDILVLATTDRIYALDANLKFRLALKGAFLPRSLSIDEARRICAIVEVEGKNFLWVLNRDGELISETRMEFAFGPTVSPPVIAFDHRVAVLGEKRLLVVDQFGKELWSSVLQDEIGGAVVTTDGELLVTSGKKVIAFSANGEQRVVADTGGPAIAVAAVPTASGDLFVTTTGELICFRVAYAD